MLFNLATIHEAIARVVPERECLVFRERRFTWSQITDRTRRLGDVLGAHGLGCRTERSQLKGCESGQDHVALYLHNGNEYLEGMLGAFKARTAPVNVNYRYVDEELVYLFENSDSRAVVFHSCFAPALARVRASLPQVKLWLQVEDGSGEALLEGALDYEKALAAAHPAEPSGLSPDDLYILYTGGTTGYPKGVLWRQEDFVFATLFPAGIESVEEIAKQAEAGGARLLAAPPFMHGAAHWAAFKAWSAGGTVVVPSEPRRLDPDDIWSTCCRERVNALTIVGDAFGRPLADQLREKSYDLSSLKIITSGGAILTASLKRELLDHLPGVQIRDAMGSSEGGSQASQLTGAEPTTGIFELNPGSALMKPDLSGPVEAGSEEEGWLVRRGPVPLGYYKDAKRSAETFPVIDGVRYAVPGDRATLTSDGRMRLLGRDSVTINSGGEKIFAEEVEHALKHHPAVYDAIVVGTPHPRWGQQVTALIKLRAGDQASEKDLNRTAGAHVASYKLPKRFIFVDEIVRSPSGKADYRWAAKRALSSP